jgi:hypothetical protein
MGEAPEQVDLEALEGALRALGMLYGARLPAGALHGGLEQTIRAYILRERAHLLACYDMETLVGLVRGALRERAAASPALEQFGPAQ